jgi:hypothetical protein
MAARGAKPKAAHLRLVDGKHRKARQGEVAEAQEAVEKSATAFGKLTRPKYFKSFGGETIFICSPRQS